MPLKWYTTVIDCADLHAQARWWAAVLDWQLIYEADDEAVIVPQHVEDRPLSAAEWLSVGPGLIFVRVPEGKTAKNRLHLDLAPHITDDRDALIESLLARGATRVDVGQDESMVSWSVLADPEGNEFCVLSARDRLLTSGHQGRRSSPRNLETKTHFLLRNRHIVQDRPPPSTAGPHVSAAVVSTELAAGLSSRSQVAGDC